MRLSAKNIDHIESLVITDPAGEIVRRSDGVCMADGTLRAFEFSRFTGGRFPAAIAKFISGKTPETYSYTKQGGYTYAVYIYK